MKKQDFKEIDREKGDGSSSALFTRDEAGKKQDAPIFDEIMAGVDDTKSRAASAKYMMRTHGFSKEDVMEMYNVSESDLGKVDPEWDY